MWRRRKCICLVSAGWRQRVWNIDDLTRSTNLDSLAECLGHAIALRCRGHDDELEILGWIWHVGQLECERICAIVHLCFCWSIHTYEGRRSCDSCTATLDDPEVQTRIQVGTWDLRRGSECENTLSLLRVSGRLGTDLQRSMLRHILLRLILAFLCVTLPKKHKKSCPERGGYSLLLCVGVKVFVPLRWLNPWHYKTKSSS